MPSLFASALLAALLPAGDAPRPVCPPGEEIPYSAAPRCVGETRRVVGRIDHVSRSKHGLTFVNFCSEWKGCPFTAIVFREAAPKFLNVARLAGSEVAVTGEITQYRGRAQVVLTGADQLVVRAPPVRRPPMAAVVDRARTIHVERKAPVAPPPADEGSAADAAIARLSASEAGEHVGERARVRGLVARAALEGGDLVLYFRRGEGELPFVAVVAEPDRERLEEAARGWDRRFVDVEGDVSLFNGRPAVYVRDAGQVTLRDRESALR